MPELNTTIQKPRAREAEYGLRNMPVDLSRLHELTEADLAETLKFLAVRPVHTVIMTGFIRDNGFDRDLNRGRFFGYRDKKGALAGVALIGHSTVFEARSDEAIEAFAIAARNSETPVHLIMSAGEDADRFWKAYSDGFAKPRLRCEEVLFEAAFPFLVRECGWDLRTADGSQLLEVARAQAEVAFIECGVDPMLRDREGFLKRVLRRIEMGRVFTVFEGEKLVFKADVISETDDVIYLEGVYVGEEYRGRNVGPECLAALTAKLFERVSNICLLSNIDFKHAHRSFEKAGYAATDKCITLFV